jgi:hypothetical protein
MSIEPVITGFAMLGLAASLVAALIVRRRYRSCYSFSLYAVAVFVPSVLFRIWPDSYTWENYVIREVLHNLLKFAIALELAYRSFRAFPTALNQARKIVFVILALVAAVAIAGTTSGGTHAALSVEWHARVLNGTIWLLSGIAAVILWYRLPVDPFHKAILVGFVPYLFLFSVGMRAMLEIGQAQTYYLQRAHGIAYVLLLAYWNRAAWSSIPAHGVLPQQELASRQPEPA